MKQTPGFLKRGRRNPQRDTNKVHAAIVQPNVKLFLLMQATTRDHQCVCWPPPFKVNSSRLPSTVHEAAIVRLLIEPRIRKPFNLEVAPIHTRGVPLWHACWPHDLKPCRSTRRHCHDIARGRPKSLRTPVELMSGTCCKSRRSKKTMLYSKNWANITWPAALRRVKITVFSHCIFPPFYTSRLFYNMHEGCPRDPLSQWPAEAPEIPWWTLPGSF